MTPARNCRTCRYAEGTYCALSARTSTDPLGSIRTWRAATGAAGGHMAPTADNCPGYAPNLEIPAEVDRVSILLLYPTDPQGIADYAACCRDGWVTLVGDLRDGFRDTFARRHTRDEIAALLTAYGWVDDGGYWRRA